MVRKHHAEMAEFEFLVARSEMRVEQFVRNVCLEFWYVDEALCGPQSEIFAGLAWPVGEMCAALERALVVDRTNTVFEQRARNAPGTVLQSVRFAIIQAVADLFQ